MVKFHGTFHVALPPLPEIGERGGLKMDKSNKERTARVNGQLWGASARDWADIQEGQFRAGYLAALERSAVGSGSDYLDAGCGAGMAAEIAAGRGANLSGLDASEELLVIARQRVPGGRFELGNLEALPFEDDSFDVDTGFNAFQFAGNLGIALAEARQVTRPGGNAVILIWGEPEGMEAASLIGALKPLLPPPPPDAPGPFALSDEKKLRGIAE